MLQADKERYKMESGGSTKRGDLNKDGVMSEYEQTRQDAIDENMRKQAQEGGLFGDDREQYVVGGLSKMLSKGISKVLKPNKVKQEINEIEKFLLDNKYPEADIFTKQELNKVKKEVDCAASCAVK